MGIKIGALYTTKNYGCVEVLGPSKKYNYYDVKFRSTGHIASFRQDAIKKGEIRDAYAVSFCDVGIIGNIKTRGKYKPYYTLWRNMIARCYNGKHKAYFGKVTVCDRWKTFEYFFQDVPSIKGWDKELYERGELEIDKDFSQQWHTRKVYSVDTCEFMVKNKNNGLQDGQQKWFKAISPTGYTYKSHNITLFAREHNLERKQISAVLNGRYNSTLGWRFKFIPKSDNDSVV